MRGMETYRHYYGKLSGAEREIYRRAEAGLLAFEKEFSLPRTDGRRLCEIIEMLRLDVPMIFHLKSFKYLTSPGRETVTFKPEYSVRKAEYLRTAEILEKRLDRILAPATGLDFFEKERFIHDYIVKNVTYERLDRKYSHEISGVLCHGIGVCEGIAKTFKAMCDFLGVPCYVMIGIGVPPEERTGKKREAHAWNGVVTEKGATGVDATFDLSLSKASLIDGSVRYDYFNVSDEVMLRDHSEVRYGAGGCPVSEFDRYLVTGDIAKKDLGGVSKIMKKAARPPYCVAFRTEGYLDREELVNEIKREAEGDKRYRRYSGFILSFDKTTGVCEIKMKRPNEREADSPVKTADKTDRKEDTDAQC